MIREFEKPDMNDVLDLWLKTSCEAHDFIEKKFWESKINDMRTIYIPSSDTYVFSDNGVLKGFFSLYHNTLAALFVAHTYQGNGIGRQLVQKAKSLRKHLILTVYKDNHESVRFYRKNGFTVIGERIDKHTGHSELVLEYNKNQALEVFPDSLTTRGCQ